MLSLSPFVSFHHNIQLRPSNPLKTITQPQLRMLGDAVFAQILSNPKSYFDFDLKYVKDPCGLIVKNKGKRVGKGAKWFPNFNHQALSWCSHKLPGFNCLTINFHRWATDVLVQICRAASAVSVFYLPKLRQISPPPPNPPPTHPPTPKSRTVPLRTSDMLPNVAAVRHQSL